MAGESKSYAFQPDYAVIPGETLAEVLEERGMSQANLARRAGLSSKHINQIIVGDASITSETGLRLEKVLGIPARFWTSLESNYREFVTRQEEQTALEADVSWLSDIPVLELVKRGFLTEKRPSVASLREVLKFYGVANKSAWNIVWATPTAYRKSRVHDVNPHALAAWLRIGEIESKEVEAEPFSRNGLREMLPELRSLTLLSVSEWGPQLIALCASVGVVVVFEPEIPGSRICGVARWIGSDRALIQMSLRHRWSDIFWFSFFHEVAHVLIHDRKRLTFVDGPPKGGDDDELELEANAFASNLLIPDGYNGVLATLTTRKSIEAFAADIGVHKGIVVGRLQHDRIVLFSQFNDLRERYVFSKEA